MSDNVCLENIFPYVIAVQEKSKISPVVTEVNIIPGAIYANNRDEAYGKVRRLAKKLFPNPLTHTVNIRVAKDLTDSLVKNIDNAFLRDEG